MNNQPKGQNHQAGENQVSSRVSNVHKSPLQLLCRGSFAATDLNRSGAAENYCRFCAFPITSIRYRGSEYDRNRIAGDILPSGDSPPILFGSVPRTSSGMVGMSLSALRGAGTPGFCI
jgi:hypothetical protein